MKHTKILTQAMVMALMSMIILMSPSCKKDDNDPTGISNEAKFTNTEMVKASISGLIVDENNAPVKGASVVIGNNMFTSDDDGYFYFSNINTHKNATAVKVTKSGYYLGIRNLMVEENSTHSITIMLLDMPTPTQFNSTAGGVVQVSGGGSLDFPANAIVDEATGTRYNGQVSVYAKYIDPSADNFQYLVPGGLRAINSDGALRYLASFGMQAVELRGAGGQELQIADGQWVNMTMPVPAEYQNGAPNRIPLWSLNESNGMWIEDGTAVLEGGVYKGSVSHFSFWNCDYPNPVVNYTISFQDQNGSPIYGVYVKLVTSNTVGNSNGHGITDPNGEASGQLPQNSSFDVYYKLPGCSFNAPYTYHSSFTSGTTNISQGPYTINTNQGTTPVEGMVVDCSGAPIANAPIKVRVNGAVFATFADAQGNFNIAINCITVATAAKVDAYDPANNVKGSANITITPNILNQIGSVQACGTQVSSITWSVTIPPATTPTVYTLTEPASTISQDFSAGGGTGINGYNLTSGEFISIYFTGPASSTGTHSLLYFGDHVDSVGVNQTTTPVNITQYGAVGGRVQGNFTITNSTSFGAYNGADISCSFNVERQN